MIPAEINLFFSLDERPADIGVWLLQQRSDYEITSSDEIDRRYEIWNHENRLHGEEIGEVLPANSKTSFIEKAFTPSFIEEGYIRDSLGRPQIPDEILRVMLEEGLFDGPGFYWDLGPNKAADPVVFRRVIKKDVDGGEIERLQVLVYTRKEFGNLDIKSLPGSMSEPSDRRMSGLLRGLLNKADVPEKILSKLQKVLETYVPDGRSTRLSWPETAVYTMEIPPEYADLELGDDGESSWIDVTTENLDSLFSVHGEFVKASVLVWQEQEGLIVGKDGSIYSGEKETQPIRGVLKEVVNIFESDVELGMADLDKIAAHMQEWQSESIEFINRITNTVNEINQGKAVQDGDKKLEKFYEKEKDSFDVVKTAQLMHIAFEMGYFSLLVKIFEEQKQDVLLDETGVLGELYLMGLNKTGKYERVLEVSEKMISINKNVHWEVSLSRGEALEKIAENNDIDKESILKQALAQYEYALEQEYHFLPLEKASKLCLKLKENKKAEIYAQLANESFKALSEFDIEFSGEQKISDYFYSHLAATDRSTSHFISGNTGFGGNLHAESFRRLDLELSNSLLEGMGLLEKEVKIGDLANFNQVVDNQIRQVFGTEGLQNLQNPPHIVYDSMVVAVKRLMGVGKGYGDGLTNISIDYAFGLGDCRHHGNKKQLLFDVWKKDLTRQALEKAHSFWKKGEFDSYKKVINSELKEIQSIQMVTADMVLKGQVGMNEKYSVDVVKSGDRRGQWKFSEEVMEIEDHSMNFIFALIDGKMMYRPADSFYKKIPGVQYGFGYEDVDKWQPLDNFFDNKSMSLGNVTVFDENKGVERQIELFLEPTVYAGERSKSDKRDTGDLSFRGAPVDVTQNTLLHLIEARVAENTEIGNSEKLDKIEIMKEKIRSWGRKEELFSRFTKIRILEDFDRESLSKERTNDLVVSLAERLQKEWRVGWIFDNRIGGSFDRYKSKWKTTSDEEWGEKNEFEPWCRYENGVWQTDIAHIDFSQLPVDWQEENLIPSKSLLNLISNSLAKVAALKYNNSFTKFLEGVKKDEVLTATLLEEWAAIMQDDWLERRRAIDPNGWPFSDKYLDGSFMNSEAYPYNNPRFSEELKNKNREQVVLALETLFGD